MDLDSAIKAHGEWKVKFRSTIAARGKLDAATIGRDNVCPLGSWLHGEAKGRFSGLRAYARCVADHATFHREAGKVATLINEEKFAEAEKQLGAGTQYTAASSAVGGAVVALRKDAGL